MKIYITGSASVLPLDSMDTKTHPDDLIGLYDIKYADYIEPKLLRRMSKVIRMAVASAKMALQKAELEMPEAIIVGTGLGCLTDTQRFLTDLCTSKEGILSPTAFIQSTHNTIAGQIALLLNCNGYNSTYSDRNQSFEQAVLDAKLHLLEGLDSILVGAADEKIDLVEQVVNSLGESETSKTVPQDYFLGEGSSFFVVSKTKKVNSLELRGPKLLPRISKSAFKDEIDAFLSAHDLKASDIDVLITSDWPGSQDTYYQVFTEQFEKAIPVVYYKKQSGHYFTSSAYALDTACYILRNQTIPRGMLPNNTSFEEIRNVLIYNNYRASKHNFYLISK